MPYIRPRKDARVVEWNSLENCLSRKANEGRDEAELVSMLTKASAFESRRFI